MQSQPPPEDEGDGHSGNRVVFLVGVAVVVVLGIWLVNKLIEMRNMQNCLASGRSNCAPITTPAR